MYEIEAMNSTLHPYPYYKPSGVVWLGDVPEHWEIIPNRALMNPRKDVVGACADDFTLLSLTRRGIIPRDVDNAFGKFPSSFDTYQVIEPGDLVFCLFDIDETPRTVGRSRLRGMVIGAYTRFVCGDVDTREFLYLLYLSLDEGKLLRPLYSGLRKTIPTATFLRAKIALPPKPEQQAIVRYLGHVDRRIRRYVSAKQKLIALLEEEKQAVVNRAVTRGLDPNVRLKPSGVEWFGDVPEHWEVSRVKTEFVSLNHRRIPLSAVERGAMSMRRYDYYGASGVIDKVEDYLFDDDLLLIAEDGANLVLRNLPLAIVASGKFWVNNHAHILKPRRGNLEYLAAVMERLNYTPWISGAAQPKLTQDRLMSIAIAVPPPSEQDEVIDKVTEETTTLRHAIARARRQIELVQEYRTRLIADVVTGKLDVREVAAQLPDEAGDQDPIEESDPLADGLPGDLYDIDESIED